MSAEAEENSTEGSEGEENEEEDGEGEDEAGEDEEVDAAEEYDEEDEEEDEEGEEEDEEGEEDEEESENASEQNKGRGSKGSKVSEPTPKGKEPPAAAPKGRGSLSKAIESTATSKGIHSAASKGADSAASAGGESTAKGRESAVTEQQSQLSKGIEAIFQEVSLTPKDASFVRYSDEINEAVQKSSKSTKSSTSSDKSDSKMQKGNTGEFRIYPENDTWHSMKRSSDHHHQTASGHAVAQQSYQTGSNQAIMQSETQYLHTVSLDQDVGQCFNAGGSNVIDPPESKEINKVEAYAKSRMRFSTAYSSDPVFRSCETVVNKLYDARIRSCAVLSYGQIAQLTSNGGSAVLQDQARNAVARGWSNSGPGAVYDSFHSIIKASGSN